MADTTILNVTAVSKIVACDYDAYESQYKDDPAGLNKYTAYLVNEGTDSSQNPFTALYYGGRRCSDISVVTSLSDDMPADRLYLILQVDGQGNPITSDDGALPFSKVIYRFRGEGTESHIDIPLVDNLFRSFTYNDESQSINVELSDGTLAEIPAIVNGSFSETLIGKLGDSLTSLGYTPEWKTVADLIGTES